MLQAQVTLVIPQVCIAAVRYYKVTADKGLWFVSAAMRAKYGTYLGQLKDKTLNQKLA